MELGVMDKEQKKRLEQLTKKFREKKLNEKRELEELAMLLDVAHRETK